MELEHIKGTHSTADEVILVSADKEAITLENVFELVKRFARNELRRIRIDIVRGQIITGHRPFMFEDAILKAIKEAKEEELEIIRKGKGDYTNEVRE